MKIPFADLYKFPEDERIKIIGQLAEKQVVAFMVDDDGGIKGDRYLSKLSNYKIRLIERFKGPVNNVETIKIGPLQS